MSIGLNSGPNKERVCMDELFHVSERKSTIGTELRAGLTTFLAMAYIIAVNPAVLSGAASMRERSPAPLAWAPAS